ncbi:unnamed protein product [marine sediment metagenome]|uniref:Uncharacterized protein n=1 Tax=marine sediment metagenome TaxID=412755 RepID=X1RRS5_9ZZZZ
MTDEMDSLMLKQIAEIEQRDESQVLAELAGELIEDMIYTVETYDRRQRKKIHKARLSWAGTKEVARSRGNLVLAEPVVTDLDATIRIMVKATDLTRNFTVFGGCQQPRKMKINDVDPDTGEITGHHFEDDAYCFQKGLSKCQRNALTLCIPADYAAKCIDRFLKATGKGKQLTPGTQKAKPPTKSQIKPLEEWNKITEDMVPDYPSLEPIIWNLSKMQPADMYQELGVTSRADMTIAPFGAFLTLKERFHPRDQEE